MKVVRPSRNSSAKPARRASCAGLAFQILRMFWLTGLTLLLVVLYGLYAGWSVPKQWSDALFYAAVGQMIFAAAVLAGAAGDTSAAADVRYIANASISDTQNQLNQLLSNKKAFALRIFIGSLLTLILAFLVVRM